MHIKARGGNRGLEAQKKKRRNCRNHPFIPTYEGFPKFQRFFSGASSPRFHPRALICLIFINVSHLQLVITKVYGASRIFPGPPLPGGGSDLSPARPAAGQSRPPLGRPKRASLKYTMISHGRRCYFWDPSFSILTNFANPLAAVSLQSLLAMSVTFKVEQVAPCGHDAHTFRDCS